MGDIVFGVCPADETLANFADGDLRPQEIEALEFHLVCCRECCATVAFLLKLNEFQLNRSIPKDD